MTTTAITPPRVTRPPGAAVGLSAGAMIAGGLLTIALGIPLAPLQNREPALWQIAALNAVSHLLLGAGVVGLARAGIAGRGRLARAGLALSLLGLAGSVVAEAVWVLAGEDAAGPFYGTSALALMVGAILAGLGVLRTGVWGGWQRCSVLATGLYIPLILLPAFALPGYAPNYAIGIWGVCWLLVGLALWQHQPATGALAEHGTARREHGRL